MENGVPSPPGKTGTWRKYPGASAGQSPMIHTLDVALSIQHSRVNPKDVANPPSNPMLEMRQSLPNEFQEFIKALAIAPSIREFCLSKGDDDQLIYPGCLDAFNKACTGLKGFRDVHIQIATQYIVLQKKNSNDNEVFGTGGTSLINFLKQTRKETEDAQILS